MRGLEHVHSETKGAGPMSPASRRGSVIVMDHHPLYRGAVRQVIATSFKGFEVKEASSLAELGDMLDGDRTVDYVFYDLATDRESSFAGLLYLRTQHPSVPLIVMSANDKPHVARRCLAFGAAAFLPKSLSAQQLSDAMRVVVDGGTWVPSELDPADLGDDDTDELILRLMRLTCQEIRVLILLCEGLFNRQIAEKLGIAEATVKAHVSKILGKLEVYSRTQAVLAVTKVEAPTATVPAAA